MNVKLVMRQALQKVLDTRTSTESCPFCFSKDVCSCDCPMQEVEHALVLATHENQQEINSRYRTVQALLGVSVRSEEDVNAALGVDIGKLSTHKFRKLIARLKQGVKHV
jgi:hypothetical protein